MFGDSPWPHRIRFIAEVNSKSCLRARLTVVHPRAASVNIGTRFHLVAVPSELDDEPVRKLTSFMKDLTLFAEWLLLIGVTTVAMESTGIYWVPLYEILVARA